jgi:hypothetical protein
VSQTIPLQMLPVALLKFHGKWQQPGKKKNIDVRVPFLQL